MNDVENPQPNENDQKDLFDEDGNLRFDLLSSGMFIMRFAPDNRTVVYTWVPDDPAVQIRRVRVSIPVPMPGDPVAGEEAFFKCLLDETAGGVDRDEAIEASLRSILKCAPKLLE